jgi:hypothetical protein
MKVPVQSQLESLKKSVRQQDQLSARRASEVQQAAGVGQPQGPVEPQAPPRPSTRFPLRVPFGQTPYSHKGKAARKQNLETQLVLTWVNLSRHRLSIGSSPGSSCFPTCSMIRNASGRKYTWG